MIEIEIFKNQEDLKQLQALAFAKFSIMFFGWKEVDDKKVYGVEEPNCLGQYPPKVKIVIEIAVVAIESVNKYSFPRKVLRTN